MLITGHIVINLDLVLHSVPRAPHELLGDQLLDRSRKIIPFTTESDEIVFGSLCDNILCFSKLPYTGKAQRSTLPSRAVRYAGAQGSPQYFVLFRPFLSLPAFLRIPQRIVRKAKILELVFRHKVAAILINMRSHSSAYSSAGAYRSILHARYDFAKFLHSGSFVPFALFMQAR